MRRGNDQIKRLSGKLGPGASVATSTVENINYLCMVSNLKFERGGKIGSPKE